MEKGLKDVNLLTTTNFPAAAASNQSAGLEIGGDEFFKGNELFVDIPASVGLAENTDIDIHIEHSADNGALDAFADVPQLAPVKITGIVGDALPTSGTYGENGYEVLDDGTVRVVFPVPRGLKAFVRVDVTVETGAGDFITLSYEFGLLVY
ncbi:hypothetical protein [Rubellicoccus peritrichatus]|uniref:Uncharacterized protein n=1 Tax=Rubellicoccus peritrichatus TaxID=3080537 RepID=A0AAQ3QV74_9BACT|nr:hypothetical protein [Puniceicoccus sp. CR14]WOO43156.1 hypothetical protein RZN69_08625 [Puniceicoccus sp. CR14]